MSSADLTVLEYIRETTPGVTPSNGVKASRVLTATANFANAETVTIGSRTYTFQTVLTNVDGNVKLGATMADSLANLARAINDEGGVSGTDYAAATTAHPDVTATFTGTTLTATARQVGDSKNSIATTEVATNASWGGATLIGGTDTSNTEWKKIRYTGESLNFTIENTQSEEIRPDRTQVDLIQTSASAAGDVNVELSYGSFDDLFEAALCGTWTGNVLTNGLVSRFHTVRKHFQDMTPAQYHLYRGTAVEGFDFSMELGSIVSGAFNLTSFGIDPDTGIMTEAIEGETYAAATTTSPMNAITNFQDFTIDGVPYSGCISSLSLALKNNIRAIMCLGSLTARDMKLGTLEITGNAEFYFNDSSIYDRFVKGLEMALTFAIEDDAGNRYDFNLPRVKFETGETVAGGKNSDVMVSTSYRALYSSTAGFVAEITRTPAA
jgi:hypothetical protein